MAIIVIVIAIILSVIANSLVSTTVGGTISFVYIFLKKILVPTRIYLTAANRKPFILPALVSAPSNLSDSGRTGRFGKSKQWKRSHPLVVETSWVLPDEGVSFHVIDFLGHYNAAVLNSKLQLSNKKYIVLLYSD